MVAVGGQRRARAAVGAIAICVYIGQLSSMNKTLTEIQKNRRQKFENRLGLLRNQL